MNSFDGLDDKMLVSLKPGKRGRPPAYHDREITKRMRHSGGGKVPQIACAHHARSNSSLCHANRLTPDDLAFNTAKFYEETSKVDQDRFILSLLQVGEPKRRRNKVDDEQKQKDRNVGVQYFLLSSHENPAKIKVCKATFIKVLGVSKDRVSRIAHYYAWNATSRPENRGGARNTELINGKRQAVINHIQSFSCKASHYGRRGTPGRKYLPSALSVHKMYELFGEQNHVQASYSLYYSVFNKHFNLGFGHPTADSCATCAKYKLQIEHPDLTEEEKCRLSALFVLHRSRAHVFYDMLDAPRPNAVTVCFDMMQNMALPKFPISQAYYSRQLYLYLFGVVVHRGKDSRQTRDDVHLYCWMEHQNKNDSNMIASALSDCFRVRLGDRIREKKQLRLFSDSCFGQNKNMGVVGMLFALTKSAGFEGLAVEYTFPIRGHSLLPANRVFGCIEHDIRKNDAILHPSEYYEILRRHGNLHVYGEDWDARDYKSEANAFVKGEKTFELGEARVLCILDDQLGVKTAYTEGYSFHGVLKRGKKWEDFSPRPLDMVSTVKDAKRRDVENLLTEIGAPEDFREFYDDALRDASDQNADAESDFSDEEESAEDYAL